MATTRNTRNTKGAKKAGTGNVNNKKDLPVAGDALGPTMAEFAESYIRHLEESGKSRGTTFSYMIDINVAVRELGAETRIRTLTPEMVQAFNESDAVTRTRTGREKAKPTIDKCRRVLRLALVWAVEQGLIPEAPLPTTPKKDGGARAGAKTAKASGAKKKKGDATTSGDTAPVRGSGS